MQKSKTNVGKTSQAATQLSSPLSNPHQRSHQPHIASSDSVRSHRGERQSKQLDLGEDKNLLGIVKKFLQSQQTKGQGREIQQEAIKQREYTNSLTLISNDTVTRQRNLGQAAGLADLLALRLQHFEIDPKLESMRSFLDHQARRMNENILKLEGLMNQNHQGDEGYKLMANFAHFLNSLILTTSFMITKIAFHQQQLIQSYDQAQIVNAELRAELLSLERNCQMLKLGMKDNQNKQTQLQKEMGRIRSVMESYQVENFQLKAQLQTLNQVITEMNVQVEKAEKKLYSKSRELRKLEENYERLLMYTHELELEVREGVNSSEVAHQLQRLNQKQEFEVKKWKARCLKEEQKD